MTENQRLDKLLMFLNITMGSGNTPLIQAIQQEIANILTVNIPATETV